MLAASMSIASPLEIRAGVHHVAVELDEHRHQHVRVAAAVDDVPLVLTGLKDELDAVFRKNPLLDGVIVSDEKVGVYKINFHVKFPLLTLLIYWCDSLPN